MNQQAQDVATVTVRMWARPRPAIRMTRRGALAKDHPKRHLIDDYLSWKTALGQLAQSDGVPLADYPVSVWITWYTRGKGRGDLDNIAKGILDALNGVAWTDDRLVSQLAIVKITQCRDDWFTVTIAPFTAPTFEEHP